MVTHRKLLILGLALLASCADPSAQEAGDSPSSASVARSESAATDEATSQIFVSDLYGYSIELPADWSTRAARARSAWVGERPDEPSDAFQADWLEAPRSGPYITAMARAVPGETDIEAWRAEMKAHIDVYEEIGTCEPIDAQGELQVAGEEAVWFTSPACEGRSLYVMWVFTVHDNTGHYFAWHSEANDPIGGRRQWEAMLETLEFTD